MSAVIKLNDVWLEDCLKWMYDLVIRDGGDGSATFICKNFEEIAELFEKSFDIKSWVKDQSYQDRISYMNYFESFTFTKNPHIEDEYTFIVENDCSEGFAPFITAIISRPVNE